MSDATPKSGVAQTRGVSNTEVSRPLVDLPKLQNLYDRNLFTQAFHEASKYWNESTRLDHLSTDELIFAIRLSARLGGYRLARWLSRTARLWDGSNPRVRYFTNYVPGKGWRLFDDFRALERNPELPGADPATQSNWLAYSALRWASIREFDRARDCIERARTWSERDEAWVLSCESDVLGMQDRWAEALAAAELSWQISPGTPFAARSLAGSLLNLRRVREAAERLAEAAQTSESFELPLLACWYLCALAETCGGDERKRVLGRARELADRVPGLALLADRETRALFARAQLDIAQLADDHREMERWAEEARCPFHRTVLSNLRHHPAGVRIRLPFRHGIQKHNECLPTSIGSAMAAIGINIDADAMAAEITFGGTAEWAAAEWLEKRGLHVRFFVATPEVSAKLIKAGFAFVVTLEYDASAHAVAVVGLDEAAGTLLVHDPQSFRGSEYLADGLGRNEAPFGPRAMVATLPDRAGLLDELLPAADAELIAAREARRRAEFLHGASAARVIVADVTALHPSHPITRLLRGLQDHEDGHIGAALAQFQTLLAEFPASAVIRSNLLACCRSLGNTAMMRKTLADVVERGVLPGVQSQQDWMLPPSDYVAEYADLLRGSAQTSDQAQRMLHALLRRHGTCAPAWHILGDILWDQRDTEGALLGYRISAHLEDRNEHYAQAYCDALGRHGREEDGLEWLAERVRRFGASSHAVATWVTWITALEQWGRPERALATAQEALTIHSNSAELLAFVIPFFGRMGKWADAEARLTQLEATGNAALFRQASVAHYRMRGDLAQAFENAEAWLREAPLAMRARRDLLDVVAKRDGPPVAIQRARAWLADHPAHDEMESLYCEQLDRLSYSSWRKYSVLLRRVKRNSADAWAWRELTFSAIYDFELADGKPRKRLAPRIAHFLQQCAHVAPGDPATLRAHAQWAEARGDWAQAVDQWLEAIDRDPKNMYACRHAWNVASRLDQDQRHAVWTRMEAALLRQAGHSHIAGEVLALVAGRFGVTLAEEAASRWGALRVDDPEVVEAHADLLLNHGHGRTDYEKALQLIVVGLQRFPFQVGLRFSQASALQQLGRFQEAEEVFNEIVRRHPDNSSAQIQLARVNHRHGRTEEALRALETASVRDPQNPAFPQALVEILIETNRLHEAKQAIQKGTRQFAAHVGWREHAIKYLLDCGDTAGAVQTARDGVVEHPRGAYLWLVLGRTLYQQRSFAAQGEIESCLRRSLSLNAGLFEAADYLAMLLAEQRRYSEAEEILLKIENRLGDPAPARGRIAWVHRQRAQKREALDELVALVKRSPWYDWGWHVLFDWILEDQAWDDARSLLAQVTPELSTDLPIRQRRLEVMQRAGFEVKALDEEWNSLLHDFPEDLPLRLLRYDALRDAERWPEAKTIAEATRKAHPDSPYLIARYIEVLVREEQKDESIRQLMQLFFAETERSAWPVEFAWAAIKKSHYEEDAYAGARSRLQQGQRPTERTVAILAAHADQRESGDKRTRQPFWRTWLPGRGAREVLALLDIIDSHPREREIPRADLLKQLSDSGYHRVVVRYWKRHKTKVESEIGAWAETARALTGLQRRREARKLMSGWRDRNGITMWAVANYIVNCSGVSSRQLKEIRSSCSDALAGLPHDHCARFLAYRLAEACALLGDEEGLRDTWNKYQTYFDGKLEQQEFFEVKRRYLMADLPTIARLLESDERRLYRRKVRQLWWDGLKVGMPRLDARIDARWWWLLLGMLLALKMLHELFQ